MIIIIISSSSSFIREGRNRAGWARAAREGPRRQTRKGTNGISTNGVTASFMFVDRGTSWVLPLTYVCLPQSARAHLSPICQKYYFCSGPISVDPICPQPTDKPLPQCHFRVGEVRSETRRGLASLNRGTTCPILLV